MYKKIIALLLSLCIMVGPLTWLSGCGQNSRYFSMGQWLRLVNDTFGMYSYTSDIPYFSNVGKDSEYFDAVQIATEWDVISNSSHLDPEKKVTWHDVLVTLVNVGELTDISITDAEKEKFAISIFDKNIRDYWMKRAISQEDAVLLLTKAYKMWVDKEYENPVSECKLKDNVYDISEADEVSVKNDGTIVIEGYAYGNAVKRDDIVLISGNSSDPYEKEYVKVASAETKNGDLYIYPKNEEVSLEDVYEELFIQETATPSLEDCVLYDGNGNIISVGNNVRYTKGKESYSATFVNNVEKCASNIDSSFKVNGFDISISGKLDGKFDLSIGVKSPNLLEGDNPKVNLGAKFSLSDVKVTQDVDYGIFKGLKSASIKLDYELKQTYSATYKNSKKFIAAPENNGNGKFLTNLKKALVTDMREKGGAKTIASKKKIKIASCNIYNATVAKVCLDIYLEVGISGSLELSITNKNSNGVEYKNGNIRFIKDAKRDVDFTAKASAEATLNIGPALYLVGLKTCLAGVEVQVGVGASASVTYHLVDSDRHKVEELDFSDISPESLAEIVIPDVSYDVEEMIKIAKSRGGIYPSTLSQIVLTTDQCLNINVYGLLSIGLTDNSYLAKVLPVDKTTLKIKIWTEKNAVFLNYHVENWDFSNGILSLGAEAKKDHCTLKFKDFDKDGDDSDTDEDTDALEASASANGTILTGDNIGLSTMAVTLDVGSKETVSILTIPKGYSVSDIEYVSKDPSIASVDKNGTIVAKKTGSVIVYARTKDGKYEAPIAVIIMSSGNSGVW